MPLIFSLSPASASAASKNPNQIKSATDNNGGFSGGDASILHAADPTRNLDNAERGGSMSRVSDQDRVAQDNQQILLPAGETSKSARIKKLRHSQPLTVTDGEWRGKYELNPRSAQSYIKDQLRGSYIPAML